MASYKTLSGYLIAICGNSNMLFPPFLFGYNRISYGYHDVWKNAIVFHEIEGSAFVALLIFQYVRDADWNG